VPGGGWHRSPAAKLQGLLPEYPAWTNPLGTAKRPQLCVQLIIRSVTAVSLPPHPRAFLFWLCQVKHGIQVRLV
jgi:hypothetical protein